MSVYISKIIITTLMVILISEVARRSSFVGALIASLPVVSILSLVWLYKETQDIHQVVTLSINIFWLVIPSLAFFLVLPFLIHLNWGFYPSLFCASLVTITCYFLTILILDNLAITR